MRVLQVEMDDPFKPQTACQTKGYSMSTPPDARATLTDPNTLLLAGISVSLFSDHIPRFVFSNYPPKLQIYRKTRRSL